MPLAFLGCRAIEQPKIKILAWNLVHMLVAHNSIIHIPFFISIIALIFGHLFLINWNLIFEGQKPKISKIWDSHFAERVIWHLLVFGVAFNFKILHSRSNWFFDTKWREVTKTPLSQKLLNGFRRNFVSRCQIDAKYGTVSFASISALFFKLLRKFARGGGVIRPPPSQWWVKPNSGLQLIQPCKGHFMSSQDQLRPTRGP